MLTDARLAADLAERAGTLLRALRDELSAGGPPPPDLGSRGDAQSNDFLLAELAAARPGDAVLSEESADDPARLTADRVWIIDPLDGTREYAIPGRSDWAVHVALWERGRGITAAAVAQPALGRVHVSDAPCHAADPGEPRLLVSDSRPPVWAADVAAAVGARLVPMGSAGAKAMAVVRGEADGYLHAGGQYEWDSAAPVGVALAAGLHASRVDGSPLEYNRPHPYLPDLLICRAAWRTPLLEAVAAASAGSR